MRPDGKPVGVPGNPTGSAKDSDADLAQLAAFRRTVTVELVEPAASGEGTAGGGYDRAEPHARRRRVTVRVLWRGVDPPRPLAERVAVISRARD